jgi:hypothetical protein
MTEHHDRKARSYTVRSSLPGAVAGHDWSANLSPDKHVFVRALDNTPHVPMGTVIRIVSTTNAGFAGITGMGLVDHVGFVHLGSLGDYEVVA